VKLDTRLDNRVLDLRVSVWNLNLKQLLDMIADDLEFLYLHFTISRESSIPRIFISVRQNYVFFLNNDTFPFLKRGFCRNSYT
jgi:hypothetical protein